ncbi:MAG TPA: CDGSH iron-sulfur domain-containing protein [Solirubrobacterales bacterium]
MAIAPILYPFELGFSILPAGQAAEVATELTPYPDGPYLLRGEFRLTTPGGEEIDPRRKTVALCRCGASRRKPFCDGTHKLIGFKAPGRKPPS